MHDHFDARVVPSWVLNLVRQIQARARCQLGGGVALSGAHLSHRLSHDVDLFFSNQEELRLLTSQLIDVGLAHSIAVTIVQDAGSFVRARAKQGADVFDVDLVVESSAPLAAGQVLDEVRLISFDDLRAGKVTCLLSRSEPRDLVDALFLDRAGFAPENDLGGALTKDTGIDPSTLGWLLTDFPVAPLPEMLSPLTSQELRVFRDELRERLRRVALDKLP